MSHWCSPDLTNISVMKFKHPFTRNLQYMCVWREAIFYVIRLTCNCVQLHWRVLGFWLWRRLEEGSHAWRRDVRNLQGYCGLKERTPIEDLKSCNNSVKICNKNLFPERKKKLTVAELISNLIIIRIFYWAANQHIRMISSEDHVTLKTDGYWKFNLAITVLNYILQYNMNILYIIILQNNTVYSIYCLKMLST